MSSTTPILAALLALGLVACTSRANVYPNMPYPPEGTGQAIEPEDEAPPAQGAYYAPPPVQPAPTTMGSPQPTIVVRMVAIVTADDNGANSAGVQAYDIGRAVQTANEFYRAAGIVLEYDPLRSYEFRRSSYLNADCTLDSGVFSWGSPGQSPSCDKDPNRAERSRVARAHPSQMVVYFRNFKDRPQYDTRRRGWRLARATGGYSSSEQEFVVMAPGVDATALAHEIGHYLHLSHTFRSEPRTIAAAADILRRYVEREGHRREEGIAAFDGDLTTIGDTPPDPGHLIYPSVGLDACGPVDAINIPVTFSDGTSLVYTAMPNRHNIMSYFKGCGFYHDFSPQQIARMRDALLNGNRRNVAYWR